MSTEQERAAFEAALARMPDWAPEFEQHRAWAEQLCWFVWLDAKTHARTALAAPMSQPNRLIAYRAAEKLRELGYGWSEETQAWAALAAAPVQAVPDGYKLMAVKGFDELMTALNRAESKGYLPDAVAEHWSAFDWRASPSAAQQPAERVPLTRAQVDACWDGLMPSGHGKSRYDIARAVEQAHGIRAAGVKEPGNAAAHRTLEAERRKGSGAA